VAEPTQARLKLDDGNELQEEDLLELVEYGSLSVVSREWLGREHSDHETECSDDEGEPSESSVEADGESGGDPEAMESETEADFDGQDDDRHHDQPTGTDGENDL
jgi:hypothetical protein